MKKCVACGASYLSSAIHCATCGAEPEIQKGFPTYAPAFAQEGGGFKASYFANLSTLEDSILGYGKTLDNHYT